MTGSTRTSKKKKALSGAIPGGEFLRALTEAPVRGGEFLRTTLKTPVLFFVGSERALLDDALKGLEGALVNNQFRDFNLDVVNARQGDGERIAGLARSAPIQSEARLVIVRNAGELDDGDWTQLASCLDHPPATTCLVFLMPVHDGEIRGGTRVTYVDFSFGANNPVKEFLGSEEARLGIHLEGDAREAMLSRHWDSLQEIRQEMEKISSFAGGRKKISGTELAQVSEGRDAVQFFDLPNALRDRNAGRALEILQDSLDNGDPEVKILGQIAWAVRKQYADNPRATHDAARKAFSLLLETDRRLKGGLTNRRAALEALIIALAGYR